METSGTSACTKLSRGWPPIPIPPAEVLGPTVITAVTAVAATTVATPIIQDIKERITKFLNNK